jgi:transposase
MFVGMDVHKESIDISLAEEGRDGEVRHYGGITGDLEALAKVVKALRAPTRRLRFVYEAGPCGFGIHRYLTAQGEECVVVNPSSMPKRSGDRIKTDRRDGDALARLHRAGELTAIDIPTADDEALRDLVRAREDAVGLSTQTQTGPVEQRTHQPRHVRHLSQHAHHLFARQHARHMGRTLRPHQAIESAQRPPDHMPVEKQDRA